MEKVFVISKYKTNLSVKEYSFEAFKLQNESVIIKSPSCDKVIVVFQKENDNVDYRFFLNDECLNNSNSCKQFLKDLNLPCNYSILNVNATEGINRTYTFVSEISNKSIDICLEKNLEYGEQISYNNCLQNLSDAEIQKLKEQKTVEGVKEPENEVMLHFREKQLDKNNEHSETNNPYENFTEDDLINVLSEMAENGDFEDDEDSCLDIGTILSSELQKPVKELSYNEFLDECSDKEFIESLKNNSQQEYEWNITIENYRKEPEINKKR